MDDLINYYSFSKEEWKHFYNEIDLPLTQNGLRHIKAFNDRISIQDVSCLLYTSPSPRDTR